MVLELLQPPPLLTSDLPGIGGRIKSVPEDFEVEEIPAYQPCGSGDHLYLWLEKRGMGAEYFTRQIAQRLGISSQDVGVAGLKDRHAVTRQMVSVPAGVEERLEQLRGDGIDILSVNRHTNKLKPGHLHGNRFHILVRDPEPTPDLQDRVSAIVSYIRNHGMANFYGPQRFGHDGETAKMGLALISKELGEELSVAEENRPRKPFLKKLALSAAQSALFNFYLAKRINDGLLHRVLQGDVMSKWPTGGLFVAEEVTIEQERLDAREIVTAGPIFGKKTFPAKEQAKEREDAVLTEFGIPHHAFNNFGKLTMGTRRQNLIYVDDLAFELEPEGVRFTFSLSAGSYATVLLNELMKTVEWEEEDANQ